MGSGIPIKNPVMQKAAKRVFVLQGESCSARNESPPIIKADLRERMLRMEKKILRKSKLEEQGNVEAAGKGCGATLA